MSNICLTGLQKWQKVSIVVVFSIKLNYSNCLICRILLRWKRSTRTRGDSAVEELTKALLGMGRQDIVSIVTENHRRNSELTPASFAHLSHDDDTDESHPTHRHGSIPVKEFTF